MPFEKVKTVEDMKRILSTHGNNLSSYKKGVVIKVYNKMQKNYSYTLSENIGENMDPRFKPYYTPAEMLSIGVFEGKYINDCLLEYPKTWFTNAIKNGKLCPEKADFRVNAFGIKSRQSIFVWKEHNWLPNETGGTILSDRKTNPDVRGWFEWYCRYYIGRRLPVIDDIQIKRWLAFKRHLAQVKKNCKSKDLSCRPKQRQALLQWAYNPFV